MKSKLAVLTMVAILGMGTASMHAAESKSTTKETKAEDQAALQKEAKISMGQAREIALKKVPGSIKSSELEREHGKLIYSFDIQTSKSTTALTEVNVNAIDGKIVAIEHENAKKEADEKKQEEQEKKKQ